MLMEGAGVEPKGEAQTFGGIAGAGLDAKREAQASGSETTIAGAGLEPATPAL